ncbi:PREDICTED: At4g02000 [Prunus dulcis]|uniref:PREDICTED: At4g02000 n=1 Tax=Prunus dulcis TaxID=3755 RepID=A0A5E4FSD1_PRUDU|nr:PREDICTED: At4g02000 [Prunus dulcis]
MQKWRPSFCPAIAHITCMAAWIRVVAIQLECFDVWSLKRIGNLNQGEFAHLYVELDLTKPLEAFVQINQHWYNIEYEGLSEIYYMCGRYGHKREVCSLRVEVQLEKTPKVPIEEGSMAMNINFGDWVNKLQDWDSRLRGPWMNVQPRRKYKTNFKDGGGKSSSGTSKGSIFDPLRQVGEDFGREVDRLLVEPSLSSKTVNIMENVVPKGGKI